METTTTIPADTKEVFLKKGTCSQTFCFLLNREFGFANEAEERATDPLAGGMMNTGNQCGMLWGATLAVGAESRRMNPDPDKAMSTAITATRKILDSFSENAKTVNCREFTGCNMTNYWGLTRFMIKTLMGGIKNSPCFNLAEKWAPKAIQSATDGLTEIENTIPKNAVNCASMVAEKRSAGKEMMLQVSGFAGGMGLSGNACGALATALWMKMLSRNNDTQGKSPAYFKDPELKEMLKKFYEESGSEILCHKITGLKFKNLEEHSEFIKQGGCKKLIDKLADI